MDRDSHQQSMPDEVQRAFGNQEAEGKLRGFHKNHYSPKGYKRRINLYSVNKMSPK